MNSQLEFGLVPLVPHKLHTSPLCCNHFSERANYVLRTVKPILHVFSQHRPGLCTFELYLYKNTVALTKHKLGKMVLSEQTKLISWPTSGNIRDYQRRLASAEYEA